MVIFGIILNFRSSSSSTISFRHLPLHFSHFQTSYRSHFLLFLRRFLPFILTGVKQAYDQLR